ncbi:hypothetical protein STCU_02084 [Strigomonas culicis]|nr:hypothetical protein STCU_02084 [Strigomonas culicis]|eukprot:EPY33682.1 hypothetical protein STCU_02084 [Strigomonas culicis]
MQALGDAYKRAEHRVLSPFQTSLIVDTLRRAGVYMNGTEMALPEDDEAITPELLLNMLISMNVNKTRDERQMQAVMEKLLRLLDECTISQLLSMVRELSQLQYSSADAFTKIVKRVLKENEATDELTTMDICYLVAEAASVRGVPHLVMRRLVHLQEAQQEHFQLEDYRNVLRAFSFLGPAYRLHFNRLVEHGLQFVESMDSMTLMGFLTLFEPMNYSQRDHVEIYADALVNLASDLKEQDLVRAFVVLQRLDLMDEGVFAIMANCLLYFANNLDYRNIVPVIEVCSHVGHNSDELMKVMMGRIMECLRVLNAVQFAALVESIALYPPLKERPWLIEAFGKQATLRADLMTSESMALTAKGLAQMGYRDSDFYVLAYQISIRYGFRRWCDLEPILMGLCFAPETCKPEMTKVLASHVSQMARSLSLPEVQRAHRYMTTLQCEEDYMYRALAGRVLHFVKEITADVPDDIQVLLQRGSINRNM